VALRESGIVEKLRLHLSRKGVRLVQEDVSITVGSRTRQSNRRLPQNRSGGLSAIGMPPLDGRYRQAARSLR